PVGERGANLLHRRHAAPPGVGDVLLHSRPQVVCGLRLLGLVLGRAARQPLPVGPGLGGRRVRVHHVLPLGGQAGVEQRGHGNQDDVARRLHPTGGIPVAHVGPLGG
ncbi:unnamed protein product, partial [Heterosigma akashiwo]